MNNITLKRKTIFGGLKRSIGDLLIEEITDLGIVSIVIPTDGQSDFSDAFHHAFNTLPPKPGEVLTTNDNLIRFLGIRPDQIFALVHNAEPNCMELVSCQLNDICYYTAQSDNWCALRVSGPKVREALSRICLLDLDPQHFTEQSVARTMMEHLATIILCDGNESYLLLSGSSGALSLLDAIETSALSH